jgi:large exoprotein involved in heme utilization and adhesion
MDVVGNGADYTYVAADGSDAGAAGRVRIRAGSLGLSGYSYISADGVGDGAAGNVDIRLAGSLSVHSDAPFAYTGISATAYGNGGAGRVGIVAGENVSIRATGWRSYAAIAADSYGTGNSGLVEITAGNQVRAAGSAAAGAFAQYIATTNDAGSGAGGTVRIRAHGIELFEQGDIAASNYGSGAGTGTIDIALTGDLVIDGGATAARISSIAAENAHGPAGRIRVEAGNIILRDGGRIEGNTSGAADSASVELIVRGTLSTSDRPWDPNVDFYPSGVTLDSFDFATGNVGRITVRARNMELRAGGLSASTHALGLAGTIDVEVQERMLLDMGGLNGGIGASTFRASGDGGGGLVRIRAGELVLRNGAEIQASTTQAGNGGNIDIAVRGTMVMEQPQGAFYNTIISTQTNSWGDGVPTGNAGRVSIQASDLLMRDGAQITSSTRTSNGNAGGVSVNVSGTLDISGTSAGLIEGLGRQMALYRSGIFSDASAIDRFNPPGAGSAGEVNVNAGSLRLSGGGAIATSTAGVGNAGNVRVSASTINIGAGSEIASSTSAAGRGGNVVVSGGDVSLAGSGARIAASSGGSGAAGTVNVAASTISLGAGGAIESSSTGAGRGGSVAVSGGEVRLAGAGARIAASSTGSGDAGDILVVARALMLRDGATIATNARIADGGNIRILVPRSTEMIRLDNASITASVGGGGGSGGNIFIDPAFLVLRNSVISADAFGGAGGNITIQTNFLLASPTSRISASSALGVQGAVLVNTTQFDPAGSLATLTSDLLAPPAVLREACAARAGTAQASLVVGTPGGLPFSPEAMLPATYLAGRTLDATAGPVLAETGLVTQPIGQARQAARCG